MRSARPFPLPTLVLAGVLGTTVLAATGCRRERELPAPLVTSAALVASAPTPLASAPAPKVAVLRQAEPTAATRKAVAAAVVKGREHAQAKRWAEAVSSFEAALAVIPTDGPTLSDLAFAALQAGDLEKAEAASTRALAFVHDPSLRGQILYNQGRVFEARGDKGKAAQSYRESLTLRENEIVQKRLATLDKTPPAAPVEPLPCLQSFPSLAGLCACLTAHHKTERSDVDGEPILCAAEKPKNKEGDLFIVKSGRETLGDRSHLVVEKRGTAVRVLAEVGHDFEPGAFGVHNEGEVKSFEEQTVDGKTLWLVRWEQRNFDSNMAGLEQYAEDSKHVTFCFAPTDAAPGRCPVSIATDVHASLTYPDFKDLDEETKQLIRERKTSGYDRKTVVSFVIEGGAVKTKLVKGSAKDLPPRTIGSHKLF